MKTRSYPISPASSPLLDALYLMVAGALLEAQTAGHVKPFGVQRRTLRALFRRSGR